jgi:hypothetical protein
MSPSCRIEFRVGIRSHPRASLTNVVLILLVPNSHSYLRDASESSSPWGLVLRGSGIEREKKQPTPGGWHQALSRASDDGSGLGAAAPRH